MPLNGLNITVDVQRRTETRDSVGGASYATATVVSAVKARLGDASRGSLMLLREMGYETTRGHEIVAQPSNLNVKENDLVVVHGGQYDGQKMIVLKVKKDSLPASDPRSHVEMLVEREVEARSSP